MIVCYEWKAYYVDVDFGNMDSLHLSWKVPVV